MFEHFFIGFSGTVGKIFRYVAESVRKPLLRRAVVVVNNSLHPYLAFGNVGVNIPGAVRCGVAASLRAVVTVGRVVFVAVP